MRGQVKQTPGLARAVDWWWPCPCGEANKNEINKNLKGI